MIVLQKLVSTIILTQSVINVFGNKNSFCQTPNGETATCLLITDCPRLNEPFLADSQNKTVKDFVRQSLCGFEGDIPLVCCGRKLGMSSNYNDLLDTYLKQQKEKMENDIKTASSFKELPDRSICGLEKVQTDRIIGGDITRLDEFPWMVALEYTDRTDVEIFCGGSIINNRYVLTAAHCLRNLAVEDFQVRLGEWNIGSDKDCKDTEQTDCADPVINVGIEKIILHPFYNSRTKNNDIGLIRLSVTINYTDYIRPVCLASINSPSLNFGTKLNIAGWGTTENKTTSNLKLKAVVNLVKNSNCRAKLENQKRTNIWIGLNQLCAGDEVGKDACQGDSGGPLMRAYEDQLNGQIQWYQEGIVSWGFFCGSGPAVYTRIRRYRNWIVSQLE